MTVRDTPRDVSEILVSIDVEKCCSILLTEAEWDLFTDNEENWESWNDHCSMKSMDSSDFVFLLSDENITNIRQDISETLADVCEVLKVQGFDYVIFYA